MKRAVDIPGVRTMRTDSYLIASSLPPNNGTEVTRDNEYSGMENLFKLVGAYTTMRDMKVNVCVSLTIFVSLLAGVTQMIDVCNPMEMPAATPPRRSPSPRPDQQHI